jgi:hypothetical protein
MANDLLDLHLKLLVLERGRARVLQSLARISSVSEENIESQLASAAKAKITKSAKIQAVPGQLLAKMELEPSKRHRLESLSREFENKRFLGELRLVGKFFREHEAGIVPKTRIRALPKVLSILASLPESELDELLANCTNETAGSGFSQLAGAIMGQK